MPLEYSFLLKKNSSLWIIRPLEYTLREETSGRISSIFPSENTVKMTVKIYSRNESRRLKILFGFIAKPIKIKIK